MSVYSGDEDHGDEITSGIDAPVDSDEGAPPVEDEDIEDNEHSDVGAEG